MAEQKIIVVVNPGSTSTKMAIFEDQDEVCREVLNHDSKKLEEFGSIWDQYDYRYKSVTEWTLRFGRNPHAVVGIGGLLRPLPSGTYVVNEKMIQDARANLQGEHASNLGCAIAKELARQYGSQAYIVDPVSVDEFEPLARYSGHPLIQRKTLSHALNIHATARRAAKELAIPYLDSSFIVAHLGGGISVAPVKEGRIIDVNDASSDGPFSPERTGGLPLQQFITLCFSGKYSESEMRTLVMGKGGLQAYLGTKAAAEIDRRIEAGDTLAKEVFEAMGYQISKEIGAMSTVLGGKIDAVLLTGGMASSSFLMSRIRERISFIAPLIIYPGEDEMRALAEGVLRVFNGEEKAMEY